MVLVCVILCVRRDYLDFFFHTSCNVYLFIVSVNVHVTFSVFFLFRSSSCCFYFGMIFMCSFVDGTWDFFSLSFLLRFVLPRSCDLNYTAPAARWKSLYWFKRNKNM